jgi:hypothetical protein
VLSSLEGNIPGIEWPDALTELSEELSFLNIDVFSMLELDCLSLRSSFYHRFLVFTFGPLAMIFIGVPLYLTIVGRCGTWLSQRLGTAKKSGNVQMDAYNKAYRGVLYMIFLVFPTTCRVVFKMLRSCHEMKDGTKWLKADYSLQCDGDGAIEHTAMVLLAWVMVGVYPIGIPLYFAYSLSQRAPRRAADDDTSIFAAWKKYVWKYIKCVVCFWHSVGAGGKPKVTEEDSLHMLFIEDKAEWVPNPKEVEVRGFLFEAYEPKYYYFEVVDLIRKVFFTGIIVFIAPGTPSQLIITLLVSFFVIVLYAYTKPFALDSDDTAMLMSNVHIFTFLFYGLLRKLQPQERDTMYGDVLVVLFWVQVALGLAMTPVRVSQLLPLPPPARSLYF